MPVYDAFISYSHAKDMPIATALQREIQTLGKPWYRRRALRVFRDDTSLSATPHLWPSIEEALSQSRFLVLLASPEAAASRWVNQEADYWVTHKSIDTLLIAVTNGMLSWDRETGDFQWSKDTPLPPALKGRSAAEPRWIELQSYRGEVRPRDAKFQELAANFAAAIQGIAKEDLLSQEIRQQRRALRHAVAAVIMLAALAGTTAWQWSVAVAQRDRAERTLAAATRTANSLVFDLAQRFRDRIGIPQTFIISLLTQARTLVDDLAKTGDARPDLLQSQGSALAELSSALLSQGDAGSAVETAAAAKSIFQALLTTGKKQIDWETGLSVSYDRLGNAQAKLDKRDEALAAYRQSLAINERLVTQDASGNIKHNIAVAREKIGDVLASSGDDAQALQQYRESLALREALIAEHPNTSEYRRELAVSYEKLGRLLARSGKVDEALDAFQRSLAIAEQLAARERDNARRQRDLAVAYQEIGDALSGKGRRLEALDLYRKDLAITRQLAQSDPDRMEWQRDLMTSLDRLGSALFDDQPAGEWLVLYREAITISARIAGHDASRVDWQHDEAMMRQKLADRLRKTNQLDEALTAYRESLEIRKKLAALPSIPPDWDGELTQNYQHIGAILLDQGKPNDALALAEGRLELVRAIRSGASPPLALASALGNVGWYGIFAGAFQRAIIASEEAIALAPDLLWLRANRAHALMFSGAIAAARSEYLAHKGELLDVALKKTWEASVAEDFGIFRKASLASPLMDEMERSWSRQGRDDGALRSP